MAGQPSNSGSPFPGLRWTLVWLLIGAAAALAEYPRMSRDMLWRPYADDAATLGLYHLDEAAPATADAAGGDALDEKPAGGGLDELDLGAGTRPDAPRTSGANITANAARVGNSSAQAGGLQGGCKLVPEGRFGGGLQFSGGDGRLVHAAGGRIDSRTLEFWLRPEELPAQPATLVTFTASTAVKEAAVKQGQALVAPRLQLLPDGALQVLWRNQPLPSPEPRLKPGQWTHVALSWTTLWPYAEQLLVMVNGRLVLRHQLKEHTGPECSQSGFVLGNTPDGRNGFKGLVDEVRLSNKIRQYYDYDLDWPQPGRAFALAAGQPLFRDAADLLFRAGFNKRLQPEPCAAGTEFKEFAVNSADEELDAGKVSRLFPPGLEGAALMTGEKSLAPVYHGAGNFATARGTLAFWLQPLDWDTYTRDNRFDAQQPLVFGLFQIDGEYMDGSYDRQFRPRGPLLEFNINLNVDEEADNPVDLAPGAWTHIAMTWEGTDFTYYVNGERRHPNGTWSLWLPIYPGHDPRNPAKPEWWLKARPDAIRFGARTYWEQLKTSMPRSAVEDFRVYRRPLALSEIRNLVRLFDPRTPPQPLPPADMEMTYNGVSGRVSAKLVPLMEKYRDAASVSVAVHKEGTTAPTGTASVAFDERKQAQVTVNTPPLEFAAYTVAARIQDQAGALLATVSDHFKREPPPWYGSQAGLADKVMPEWTPMTAAGSVVSVWGREIHLAPSGLPAKVVSAGADVLAAPVSLSAATKGQPIPLTPGAGTEIMSAKPVRVDWGGTLAAPEFSVSTKGYAEFDGMMWFEVTLAPRPGAAPVLDSLVLKVPYAATSAELLHAWTGERNFRDPRVARIGTLPAGDGVVYRSNDKTAVPLIAKQKGTFIPYVMLTGMARGMAWFGENDRGWTPSTDVPAVSIVREKDTVTLVLNIISAETKLDAPRTFAFGLHPIPVKPLDPNWRQSPSYSNVYPDTFCGNNLKGRRGSSTFSVAPENDDWDAVMARVRGEGLTKGAAGLKGLYEGQLKGYRERYGKEPLPVGTTVPGLYWDMQWNAVTGLAHSREWAETWAPDYQYYTPDFINFCSWAWDNWIRKTDKFVQGNYMDDCWGSPQTKEGGPATYTLADGTVQPGYQFRAWRERFKRMRQISWDHGLYPHHTAHTTHTYLIPYHSFFDLILDGEDFYSTPPNQDDFIDHWPLDRMRFMHNGKWGQITTWLGWAGNSLKTDKWPAWTFRQTRAYIANLALHDILWGFDQQLMDDFGLKAADTVFVPYWADGGLAKHEHPDLKVCAWKRGGKALVLLVNIGKARLEAKVQLDPKVLGMAGGATVKVTDVDPALLSYFKDDVTTIKAADVEKKAMDEDLGSKAVKGDDKDLDLDVSDEDLPLAERRAKDPDGKFSWQDGVLACPVRRHDFRLFEVAPQR